MSGLVIKISDKVISEGELVSREEAKGFFTVSWPNDDDLNTLVVYDPDAVFIHYLVVNIPGNNIRDGLKIVYYTAPKPPGEDTHEYEVVVFKQEAEIEQTQVDRRDSMQEYIDENELDEKYSMSFRVGEEGKNAFVSWDKPEGDETVGKSSVFSKNTPMKKKKSVGSKKAKPVKKAKKGKKAKVESENESDVSDDSVEEPESGSDGDIEDESQGEVQAEEVDGTESRSRSRGGRSEIKSKSNLSAGQKKYCECVAKVGAKQGSSVNKYAICASSTGSSTGRGGCGNDYNWKNMSIDELSSYLKDKGVKTTSRNRASLMRQLNNYKENE